MEIVTIAEIYYQWIKLVGRKQRPKEAPILMDHDQRTYCQLLYEFAVPKGRVATPLQGAAAYVTDVCVAFIYLLLSLIYQFCFLIKESYTWELAPSVLPLFSQKKDLWFQLYWSNRDSELCAFILLIIFILIFARIQSISNHPFISAAFYVYVLQIQV